MASQLEGPGGVQAISATSLPLPTGAATQTTLAEIAIDTDNLSTIAANQTNGTQTVQTTPPTLTKGTQGTTGYSVQDLKDAGRTYVTIFANQVASVATEALVTFTANKGGVNQLASTSYTVTGGKTFRIQAFYYMSVEAVAGGVNTFVRVRVASVVSATSPTLLAGQQQNPGHLNGSPPPVSYAIPDGLEISGGQQIGITHGGQTGVTEDIILIGYEY